MTVLENTLKLTNFCPRLSKARMQHFFLKTLEFIFTLEIIDNNGMLEEFF